MRRTITKKVLSGIILATYLMFYSAPMGFCITSIPTPTVNAEVNKPVLRSASSPSSLKLEGDLCISKRNPKISLSLRNSDVQQVLRMFADKAGLNIIFHSSVPQSAGGGAPNPSSSDPNSQSNGPAANASNQGGGGPQGGNSQGGGSQSAASGTVTMDLVNVPLNDAFKMVLQVSGLTYFIENNTIIIASAQAAKSLNLAKQELMIVPVQYVDAASLANFLNKDIFSINKPGLSNANIAVTNPGKNEILIFGTKNDYLMAKKIVAQFDVKPLEETFVVNHTTPKEMATLLCNVLFKKTSNSSGSSGSSDNGSSDNNSGGSSSGGAAGLVTGFASDDSSGSSSSSSSDSGSSSGGSSSGITLGSGVVACQYNSALNAGSLTSLNTNSMSVTYFPQRGTISIIGGSAQQMALAKDFIAQNDKKQPQAYLEISIIELSESGTRDFSNTWKVWSNFFSGTFDGTTTTNPLYPNFFRGEGYSVVDSSDPTKVKYTISKFTGTPTITYAMSYLIKNGKGRVLANPRIIITNGQQSTIDLSSDYIKTVTSQIMTSSSGTVNAVQKTYSVGNDEGIKVDMTPFISPEGYVTLNIKPNYGTIKEKVTELNSNTNQQDLVATLLQRRNLDLKNIRIKDGETLVIGGMIRENEQKTVAKVPVLGDLPGVGMFFRNTHNERDKQELVIMLTPKIIKDSEDIVNKPTDNTL